MGERLFPLPWLEVATREAEGSCAAEERSEAMLASKSPWSSLDERL